MGHRMLAVTFYRFVLYDDCSLKTYEIKHPYGHQKINNWYFKRIKLIKRKKAGISADQIDIILHGYNCLPQTLLLEGKGARVGFFNNKKGFELHLALGEVLDTWSIILGWIVMDKPAASRLQLDD